MKEPCSAVSFCSPGPPTPLFLSPIFVCSGRPYRGVGGVKGEGGLERDKPSMVLCGEIIWRADNARRVSSLPPLFSPLLPPFSSSQEVPGGARGYPNMSIGSHPWQNVSRAPHPLPPLTPATRPYVPNPTTTSRLGR